MIKTSIFSALAALVLALGVLHAQSPVIVQAADSAATTPAAAAPASAPASNDSKTMLQSLQDMQTMNEATIRKQEAALATLEELQKAAEELKIFSKRG